MWPSPGIPTKKVDVAIIGENNDGLKTINEYVVVKDLGKCSLGSLALIMNADQKQFALKTTQRKQAAASLAQLSSEVAALMRLHHPNVIKLHEVIDDARHAELFLVFEYAEGGPIMKLDEHGVAEGGPLELERAKRYTSQIVEGLVHLHRNNILHMNLQPSNILLDAHDTVKIVDFRVARVFQGEDDTIPCSTPVGGSPMFMAPEMCRTMRGLHEGYSGILGDIWALGVTLYVFIWGHLPWKVTTDLEALRDEIAYRTIKFPNVQDDELVLLLSRMLDRDVVRRITTNEIRNHPWLTGTVIPTGHAAAAVPKGDGDESDESEKEPARQEDSGKTRILIVEDVALIRKTYVIMLNFILNPEADVELVTVTDGDEAVQECRRSSYKLVLMDFHMSRLTGVEATQRIRQNEKDKGLPRCNIVGMTGDNHKEVKEECLKAGMDDVVAKPLVVDMMREICIKYDIEVTTLKNSAWIPDSSTPHALLSSYEHFMNKKSSTSPCESDRPRDATPDSRSPPVMQPAPAAASSAATLATGAASSAMSSTDAPPAEAKKDSAEATAAAAEALQIREASKAWMFKNRKKKVAFQFNDVPIDECEPWALGMALKELKDNDVTLASVECAELHESIRKVISKDSIQMQQMQRLASDPQSLRVSLENLDTVVKSVLAPFLCSIMEKDRHVPETQIHDHGEKGCRGTMEDTWCLLEHLRSFCGFPVPEGQKDDIFIGLYDGHMGKEAAEYARDHLHYYLCHQPTYESDLASALVKAFFQTHTGFIRSAPGSEAGTTATAVIIRGNMLYVTNAGDARVVLCRDQHPEVLTKMHRPQDPEEAELVRNRGGLVYFYNGAWRVNATLSVSRSLGDYSCQQYITCEPEVVVREIDPTRDEFLVVASDGLWDYMSPEEVVAFVHQCRLEVDDACTNRWMKRGGLNSPTSGDTETDDSESMQTYGIVTAALVDEALEKGSEDNVSCVIVHFQNNLMGVGLAHGPDA